MKEDPGVADTSNTEAEATGNGLDPCRLQKVALKDFVRHEPRVCRIGANGEVLQTGSSPLNAAADPSLTPIVTG